MSETAEEEGGEGAHEKGQADLGKVIMVLAVLFFYVPILFMIIFSFNSGRSLDQL